MCNIKLLLVNIKDKHCISNHLMYYIYSSVLTPWGCLLHNVYIRGHHSLQNLAWQIQIHWLNCSYYLWSGVELVYQVSVAFYWNMLRKVSCVDDHPSDNNNNNNNNRFFMMKSYWSTVRCYRVCKHINYLEKCKEVCSFNQVDELRKDSLRPN